MKVYQPVEKLCPGSHLPEKIKLQNFWTIHLVTYLVQPPNQLAQKSALRYNGALLSALAESGLAVSILISEDTGSIGQDPMVRPPAVQGMYSTCHLDLQQSYL